MHYKLVFGEAFSGRDRKWFRGQGWVIVTRLIPALLGIVVLLMGLMRVMVVGERIEMR